MNDEWDTSMNSAIQAVPGAAGNTEGWARAIGQTALAATLCEVAAFPKPGLVDPVSSGAHQDMDYFTFLKSAAALAPYFIEFARLGAARRGALEDVSGEILSVSRSNLLPMLRRAGLEAERAMFAATGGANTHKGLIFSMGLLCAAAGSLIGEAMARKDPDITAIARSVIHAEPAMSVPHVFSAESCARAAADIVAGICSRELAPLAEGNVASQGLNLSSRAAPHARGVSATPRAPSTSGEALFLQLGVRGIRGEAEAGFPSVIGRALPRLRADLAAGATYNAAMVDALLELCLCVDDTTVLNRAGVEGLAYVRAQAAKALARGGMLSGQGRTYIRELDEDFSARGLSPGGCADLLAVTVFLDKLPVVLAQERRQES